MDALAIWHAAPGFRPRSTRATAPQPGRGPSDRRRELSEQRVVATEHIIDLRHDDRIGAVLTQKSSRGHELRQAGSAGSGMPDDVGPPNGVSTPNISLARPSRAVVAARKLRPHFAKQPRSRVRGDAIEDEAGGFKLLSCPRRRRGPRRGSPATRNITPSSITLRPLAASVVPVVVMSTISSAMPAAGAPSVAPALSTMR